MIVIRPEQRHAVSAHDLEGLVLVVRDHLRASFREQLEPRDEDALDEKVRSLVERGIGLGLVSARDLCRLANLAVTFGWSFLDRHANAWMIEEFLANETLGTPGQRMALLVDRCLRRMAVREHNDAMQSGRMPATDGR
jgi:hypothetical protein